MEGAANQALLAFLAELLEIHKNQVEIVAGLSSERKLISLVGIAPHTVDEIIHRAVRTAEAKHGTAHLKSEEENEA